MLRKIHKDPSLRFGMTQRASLSFRAQREIFRFKRLAGTQVFRQPLSIRASVVWGRLIYNVRECAPTTPTMKSEPSTLSVHKRQTGALFSAVILLLAGCASSRVPPAIGKAPEKPILVPQVQQEPERFLDRRVRWGGTIVTVRNRKRTTEIEVLSRPLDSGGQPRGKEPGTGRFIALLTGFADPAEYPEKRLLTVTGRLKHVATRPIGEYPYPYPVVAVEQPYLWPEPSPSEPPYFYPDPWYYPWHYPWHPWYW